ncbi:MAG: hypothetical protein OXF42_01610 [Candidatus Dadabacteria bacterium]|nr:hypothetical protein [Candidatus Dadabacteria bacterium]
MSPRRIDTAMARKRPEKNYIRNEWVKIVKNIQEKRSDTGVPLYVTLSGREGKDIDCLIKHGILEQTETGAIRDKDTWKVVAIEKNGPAATELRRKFPGLDVRNDDVLDLICGPGEISYPNSDNEDEIKLWKASVVNLDYDSSLKMTLEGRSVRFGVIQTLKKISAIQNECTSGEWYIFLTLNATLNFGAEHWNYIKETLNDNLRQVPRFRDDFFTKIIVQKGLTQIEDSIITNIKSCSSLQQKLLLSLVPKLLAQKTRDHMWAISVNQSFMYGDNADNGARMTSWIINFKKPLNSKINTDDQCYKQNVSGILANTVRLDSKGKPHPLK